MILHFFSDVFFILKIRFFFSLSEKKIGKLHEAARDGNLEKVIKYIFGNLEKVSIHI